MLVTVTIFFHPSTLFRSLHIFYPASIPFVDNWNLDPMSAADLVVRNLDNANYLQSNMFSI